MLSSYTLVHMTLITHNTRPALIQQTFSEIDLAKNDSRTYWFLL